MLSIKCLSTALKVLIFGKHKFLFEELKCNIDSAFLFVAYEYAMAMAMGGGLFGYGRALCGHSFNFHPITMRIAGLVQPNLFGEPKYN